MATTVTPTGQPYVDRLERLWGEREGLLGWITTTDHKRIGILYFYTTFVFFLLGGI